MENIFCLLPLLMVILKFYETFMIYFRMRSWAQKLPRINGWMHYTGFKQWRWKDIHYLIKKQQFLFLKNQIQKNYTILLSSIQAYPDHKSTLKIFSRITASIQKQPFTNALQNKRSFRFRKFQRKTPVFQSLYFCNFIEKDTPTLLFFCETSEIFKNTSGNLLPRLVTEDFCLRAF